MDRRFRDGFAAIETKARAAFDACPGKKATVDAEQKKAFALHVRANHPVLAPILFAMVGNKSYDAILWTRIRPRGDEETTFKVDES